MSTPSEQVKTAAEKAEEYAKENVCSLPGEHPEIVKSERIVAAAHWLAGHAEGMREAMVSDEVKALALALDFYTGVGGTDSRRIEWNEHVCDSYSGIQWAPDWLGEMQDEPGEIAIKALDRFEKFKTELKR